MSKPMIRCCANCEHSKQSELFGIEVTYCKSKHRVIKQPNKRYLALLCRFYKQRSDDNENPN